MRREAIIFPAPNRAELHSEEFDPRPGPHEVLIETEVSFISTGTELAHYTAQEPRARYPWRPGYANVGVVRERGDRVRAPELGARVLTYSPHASWVKCRTDRMIVPVPERLEPGIAAASIMAGIAAAGLVYAEVRGWPWTAIFGLGLVGNLAAQSFQIAGCRVIGIDPLARRRELARLCGVERTIGGGPEEVLEAIRELTGGAMASISVDAVGHSAVVTEALQATARFGQLILLGSPRVPVKGDLTELLSELHLQSITLRGALQSTPSPLSGRSSRRSAPFSLH
ncbi:MAG: hypothetical protein KatS3mg115_1541 [Candidatus Poribacteria bacterium]|nr:MAG: hypothetical protein KatS3mg115_1541 [Candidatus Poribacteria bacterium]